MPSFNLNNISIRQCACIVLIVPELVSRSFSLPLHCLHVLLFDLSIAVCRHEPYNFSADCYSYTVLLWQILTLSKPYEGMNRQSHAERVVYGTERPHLPTSWPNPLRQLLKNGWHPCLHHRPSMKAMHNQVCLVLGRLDGSSTEMSNFSTKNSPSFSNKKTSRRAKAA